MFEFLNAVGSSLSGSLAIGPSTNPAIAVMLAVLLTLVAAAIISPLMVAIGKMMKKIPIMGSKLALSASLGIMIVLFGTIYSVIASSYFAAAATVVAAGILFEIWRVIARHVTVTSICHLSR